MKNDIKCTISDIKQLTKEIEWNFENLLTLESLKVNKNCCQQHLIKQIDKMTQMSLELKQKILTYK